MREKRLQSELEFDSFPRGATHQPGCNVCFESECNASVASSRLHGCNSPGPTDAVSFEINPKEFCVIVFTSWLTVYISS